jgi:ubiquinone/menaquinone biosynthesis C-methylase UbiE
MALSDTEIGTIVRDYLNGSEHPDLVVYRRDFGRLFDHNHWLGEVRKFCQLGSFYNKDLLEVGCGFGWDAVGLSLVGGNRVTATDVLPSMIDGATQCLENMENKGRKLDVKPMVADICTLDLPDASFDGIFSSEAIEHVHDLQGMFKNCYRMLKPGGRLLIVNDSNQYNSTFREDTLEMWKERDQSWDHANWLRDEVRPVEHKNAKPYAAMRAEIIAKAAPQLSTDDQARLAAATAGMVALEIEQACHDFQARGSLPTPPKFAWCRNPETGEYAERLLDPFELKQWLSEAGFPSVRMRHGFNRFPFTLVDGIEFRPLNEFLFDRKAKFFLIAEK